MWRNRNDVLEIGLVVLVVEDLLLIHVRFRERVFQTRGIQKQNLPGIVKMKESALPE
jgi:hypothetical protein